MVYPRTLANSSSSAAGRLSWIPDSQGFMGHHGSAPGSWLHEDAPPCSCLQMLSPFPTCWHWNVSCLLQAPTSDLSPPPPPTVTKLWDHSIATLLGDFTQKTYRSFPSFRRALVELGFCVKFWIISVSTWVSLLAPFSSSPSTIPPSPPLGQSHPWL